MFQLAFSWSNTAVGCVCCTPPAGLGFLLRVPTNWCRAPHPKRRQNPWASATQNRATTAHCRTPPVRRAAPEWARTLVLTDWVTLACTAPIVAGLVVFMVYLVQVCGASWVVGWLG